MRITSLKKPNLKSVAVRFFAVAWLFFWFASALPPLISLATATVAKNEVCQLSCCLGLPAHSAGSCAGGSCHLLAKKKLVSPEIICGIKEIAEKQIAAGNKSLDSFAGRDLPDVPIFDETRTDESHDKSTFVQTKTFERPCQMICSVGASSNSGQQSGRDAGDKNVALLSFADQPRPPTIAQLKFSNCLVVQFSEKLWRQTPARAPPVFFS